MIAVFKRELKSYFLTPLGYTFMGLFLLIAGFFFSYGNLLPRSPRYAQFFGNILFIYLIAVPLLTMRLLSDERRLKTDQLLLTSPIKVSGIVLGKYLAAFSVFLITLAVTVLYAVLIGIHGDLAVAETIGAYLGFVLLGACFISVGTFISAVTENQVTSAFFTFFALLFIWLIDLVRQIVPMDLTSGLIFAAVAVVAITVYFYLNTRNLIVAAAALLIGAGALTATFFLSRSFFLGIMSDVLDWLSLLARFGSFSLGIVEFSTVVYYVSFTTVFLYLTVQVIEKRRWA